MKKPFETLIESEINKRNQTQNQLSGLYDFMPSFYNSFMKLPFYNGISKDETDINIIKIQDLFQFFIYDFPFKVRNILNLMEIGSYVDATILFRSVIENFIIYKYYILNNDGNGLSRYMLRQSKRSIKDIFESVIPGYYDTIYAELCKFTHNDPLILAIFRSNVKKGSLKTNINNINLDWFSYVINQLLPVIIGVLNLYKYAYPQNKITDDENLIKELNFVVEFIINDIEDRKNSCPLQKEMINYYNKIIDIK